MTDCSPSQDCSLPQDQASRDSSRNPCRVVILISGSGSNLQAMIDRFRDTPHISIVGVISNRADAKGLVRASREGIATAVLSHRDYASRDDFDVALSREVDLHQPDLVVLAGFMRILTPWFVRRYEGRLLNIHPSLLPLYRGLDTHQRALAAGDVEHGATVHLVTAELDGGPSLLQARIPVDPEETPEELAARVLVREHQIYPLAIQWYCEGRFAWHNEALWFDGELLREPVLVPAPELS